MRNEENYRKFIFEVLELNDTYENRNDILLLQEDDFDFIDKTIDSLGCTEVSKRNLGEVLKLRFGLGDNGVKMTLKEVGKLINVGCESVRAIQYMALQKLRKFYKYKNRTYKNHVFEKFLASRIKDRISTAENSYEECMEENHRLKIKLEGLEIELKNKNRIIEEKEEVIKFLKNLANNAEEIVKSSSKLNISINDLDMSTRLYNNLFMADFRTLGDIAKKTEYEMLNIRNFGRKTVDELKDILEKHGLKLGMKIF